MGRRPRDIVPHHELYSSIPSGEPIVVRCDCDIATDHTYSDWREAIRGTPHRAASETATGGPA